MTRKRPTISQVPRTATKATAEMPQQQPSSSLPFPFELQLMIISNLDIRAIVQLRQTCRLYYHYLTFNVISKMFADERGMPNPELRRCCRRCLDMPAGGYAVLDDYASADLTWRTLCFPCWRAKRSEEYRRSHGYTLTFVNGLEGKICRTCGWPVCDGSQEDNNHPAPSRHARCGVIRALSYFTIVMLTVVQISFSLLGTVIVFYICPGNLMVVIPMTIGLVLPFIYVLTTEHRVKLRMYRFRLQLITESVATILWILPVYALASGIYGLTKVDSIMGCVLFFCVSNLIINFLSTLGYLILWCGYDYRNPFLPGLPLWRKSLYTCLSLIIYCVQAW
ncbi:hypothetical protein F4779DRAFT_388252 [Xylariaceae sp. FL0662B]|nr:hypothetical protein F4779DRAFT_388252 [Xylariaceae sp. FL0662B]